MNKIQVLIMIALVALMVYYLNQEKPAHSFIAPRKLSILPGSLPKKPFSLPINNLAINLPPIQNEPKMPVFNLPETETSPVEQLFFETNPDEQYRLQILDLLETWQGNFTNLSQKSKLAQVISLLQAKNKPRGEYLQAI